MNKLQDQFAKNRKLVNDVSNRIAAFDLKKIFSAIDEKSNQDYVEPEFKLHSAKIVNLEQMYQQ